MIDFCCRADSIVGRRPLRLTHLIGDSRRGFVGASEHALNLMTLGSKQYASLWLTACYRYVFVQVLRKLPAAVTQPASRAVIGSILSKRVGEVLALFTRS
jgi:hypothetical protein